MRTCRPCFLLLLTLNVGIIIGTVFGFILGKSESKTVVETVETIKFIKILCPEGTETDVVATRDLESLGIFTVTAYCPCEKCCDEYADGITSTGAPATSGRTIAVDPSIISYGSKVIIDGHSYIAEDCGGAIKGNRIDIFFETHEEALEYGKQKHEVIVMKEDEGK